MLNTSSPFFVELLLWTIYVLLGIAVVLTLWSLWRGVKMRSSSSALSNGIPAGRIAWGVSGLLAALLAVTYGLGSTTPLLINGRTFADAFWLRVSDMVINTSLVLILLAAFGVLFGISGLSRKMK